MNNYKVTRKAVGIPKEHEGGNCYYSAFEHMYAMYKKGLHLTLVHGLVKAEGALEGHNMIHAWCELDDIVFDFSNGREIFMRRKDYLRDRLVDERRYEPKEAIKLIKDLGHYGYWDESLGEQETIQWEGIDG